MNLIYKIIICIVGFIIGYLIGNFFPLEIFQPTYTTEDLSKGDYYKFAASMTSAFITFCAVIVALFKDDFREFWKRPRIVFNSPSNFTVEDIESSLNTGSDDEKMIKASKYFSRIEIFNNGNLPALGTEMYLDKLEFIPKDSTISQLIETPGSPLNWNKEDGKSIIIPPGGRKLVNVVEIIAPEKISLPDSAKPTSLLNYLLGTSQTEKSKLKGFGRQNLVFMHKTILQ